MTVNSEGVVFGAVMNPDMTVGHSEAETMGQVSAMRGSKYVQSRISDILPFIKNDVKIYFEKYFADCKKSRTFANAKWIDL